MWQKMPIYGCHLQLCADAMLKLLASFQPSLSTLLQVILYTHLERFSHCVPDFILSQKTVFTYSPTLGGMLETA